jgi:ubiquinone/menaquinone biosynthesis C-methylase UbiE
MDATSPLPFADASLEVVFSEHFLEHIDLESARNFIRESFRVLQPGGLWRVSCPDLEAIVAMLGTDNASWRGLARVYEVIGDFPEGALRRPEHVVNWAFYGHGHRHLWTFDELRDELESAGFRDVRRQSFGESRVERAAIELRKAEAFYSIIAEATRP